MVSEEVTWGEFREFLRDLLREMELGGGAKHTEVRGVGNWFLWGVSSWGFPPPSFLPPPFGVLWFRKTGFGPPWPLYSLVILCNESAWLADTKEHISPWGATDHATLPFDRKDYLGCTRRGSYRCILNYYPINSKTISWGNSEVTPQRN